LDYFVAVAQERSFTLAAKRLHVVQSAVSAAISALERDLKVTLFERNAQRVVLTEAGTALLPEALAVLDAVRQARDVVDELRGGLRGSVRLGTLPGLVLVDLPAIAGEFRRRHPGLELHLRIEPEGSEGMIDALRNGAVDVGFLGVAGPVHRELSAWELLRVRQALAVPAGHRLARRQEVALEELVDEDFVDFPVGFGTRSLIDQLFDAAGIERRIVVEASGIASAAEFVRHGVGVAVLPPFVAVDDELLRMVGVKGQTFEWSLYVATLRRRKPTAAVRALLGLVGAHVEHLEGTRLIHQ
jgi:DNA-binding transcriptional LysR family regulator